ncbi:SDR family NAD(P)-dependent oxidoreductase [uncultured Piscinibacter sp.]|uniref:SDR family NAD(P)-dependent oxidoreductase n=1 Tax=uncultured Piscinibacter sp. TaxID=1131835 RepID=UPI00260CC038|nr:SDR family NAD(P)-dependent oxidoreductase [uncultured Piscinibacter sp.]
MADKTPGPINQDTGAAAPKSMTKRQLLAGLVTSGAVAHALLATGAAKADPLPFQVRAKPKYYPKATFVPGLSLAGKVAVITGASRGMGRATGLALQQAGVTVIGTSRQPGAYPGHPFTLLPLDLADPASINTFLATVQARPEVVGNGGIDMLVNNAGRFALGSVIPVEAGAFFGGIGLASATLYGGHVAVTSGLLNAVAARAAAGYGRIIFTTSVAAYGVGGSEPGTSYYHAYTAGKRALLAYANCLRGLLDAAQIGIRVSTVNPQPVSTDLALGTRPIFLQPVDANGDAPYDPNFQAFLGAVRAMTANGVPASFAAQAFLQLLMSTDPEPNIAVGSEAPPYSIQGLNDYITAVGLAEMQQSAYPWVAGPTAP